MKKNGKIISCKKCGKQFYISGCRIRIKKYCSVDCARIDNYGFKQRKKKCVICGNSFLVVSQLRLQNTTCSNHCHRELVRNIQKKRYSRLKNTRVEHRCKFCKKKYIGQKAYKTRFCSLECQYKYYKTNRIGAKNPYWRGGNHSATIAKNYKKYLENKGYNYVTSGCEICHKTGERFYDLHHIIYRSEAPKHKELHNPRNIIYVCRGCHTGLHRNKKTERRLLIAKRGLEKLFNRTFL